MPYSGIEINDTKLFVWVLVFSLILLFTIILGFVACFVYYNNDNAKNAKRIKALRERAATDPIAEKRLKRMERKLVRKRKDDRLSKILIFASIIALVFVNLFLCVIPGWMDYIKKDYVVYNDNPSAEQKIYVRRDLRRSTITLEDGTVLTGSLGLDEGQHNVKIVYSKRTKIALWIENQGT